MSDSEQEPKENLCFPLQRSDLMKQLKEPDTTITFDTISNLDALQDVTSAQCDGFNNVRITSSNINDVKHLSKFHKVDVIFFNECNLRDTNSLKNIHQLTTKGLDFAKNQVRNVQNLISLKGLEYLGLQRNKLPALGTISQIFTLVQLKHLNISYNNIESLPDQLGCFQNLEKINLSCNKITKFDVLQYCQQLIYINISHNNVSDMEQIKSLSHLSNIQELYFKDTKIQTDRYSENPILLNANYVKTVKHFVSISKIFDGKQINTVQEEEVVDNNFKTLLKQNVDEYTILSQNINQVPMNNKQINNIISPQTVSNQSMDSSALLLSQGVRNKRAQRVGQQAISEDEMKNRLAQMYEKKKQDFEEIQIEGQQTNLNKKKKKKGSKQNINQEVQENDNHHDQQKPMQVEDKQKNTNNDAKDNEISDISKSSSDKQKKIQQVQKVMELDATTQKLLDDSYEDDDYEDERRQRMEELKKKKIEEQKQQKIEQKQETEKNDDQTEESSEKKPVKQQLPKQPPVPLKNAVVTKQAKKNESEESSQTSSEDDSESYEEESEQSQDEIQELRDQLALFKKVLIKMQQNQKQMEQQIVVLNKKLGIDNNK